MLLFRIINLNTSGVFVYLSYSPLYLIYIVLIIFIYIGISLWTYTFSFLNLILIVLTLFLSIFFLMIDVILDNLHGITDTVTLYRTSQYCFVWFILSELGLFLSFFWSSFVLSMLSTLEFSTYINPLPLMYSYNLVQCGFIFYWIYLDIFNLLINTCFLFFSGMFCNYFYIMLYNKILYISYLFAVFSLLLGFLFIWNQLWEFSLLTFTISTNAFCSNLYTIDLLHFSHVSLGVFFLLLTSIKIINNQVSDIKMLFISCIILYWHFVDLVWFVLLRFLYFTILCVVFL